MAVKPVSGFAFNNFLQVEMSLDALKLYFSTCWMQQLELSLALWNAMKLVFTSPMDTQLITLWSASIVFLAKPEIASALFEEAMKRDGKPFHDPESPSLNHLLDLLDIQGNEDFLCKFKPHIYGVAALLVLHARNMQPHGTDDPLVLAEELEASLIGRLSRPPTLQRKKFFQEGGFCFAEDAIKKEGHPPYVDAFFEKYPSWKALIL